MPDACRDRPRVTATHSTAHAQPSPGHPVRRGRITGLGRHPACSCTPRGAASAQRYRKRQLSATDNAAERRNGQGWRTRQAFDPTKAEGKRPRSRRGSPRNRHVHAARASHANGNTPPRPSPGKIGPTGPPRPRFGYHSDRSRGPAGAPSDPASRVATSPAAFTEPRSATLPPRAPGSAGHGPAGLDAARGDRHVARSSHHLC